VQRSVIAGTALHMLEHVGATWTMNLVCVQPHKAAFKGYRCILDKEARSKWFLQQLRLFCAKGMSSVAALAKDRHLPICSAPSIHPYPALVSSSSAPLSHIILDIIFPSTRG
jgi:hypothetical protein